MTVNIHVYINIYVYKYINIYIYVYIWERVSVLLQVQPQVASVLLGSADVDPEAVVGCAVACCRCQDGKCRVSGWFSVSGW